MAWGDADKVASGHGGWGSDDPIVPNAWIDAGKSFLSGVNESLAHTADSASKILAPGLGMLKTGMDVGQALASRITGVKSPPAPSMPTMTDVAALSEHKPQTTAGRYAKTIGQNVVNAVAPGSVPVRMVNVVLPAVAEETAGGVAKAIGVGPKGQAAARFAGSMVGAAGASVRPQNLGGNVSPVGMMTDRAPQDVAAMAGRAQQYRDVGIRPTLSDVVDDSGRGVIRAAANRMTPARDEANQFATGRALDLPSRIGGQARRVMSQDARTPDEIRQAMATQRSTNADAAFGAVRGDTIDLPPQTVTALRSGYGRDAIREAAARERDPETRAALNRLADDALDNPGGTQITVGMADRISRVLLSKARAAGADNDLASILGGLGRDVRQPAAAASPGYQSALEGYGADSRLHNAVGVGEGLMTSDTDEFAAQARGLQPEERDLALAAGRRAVERRAGETISGAPNIARMIADAPEQQARNAALMGAERANDLQQGMRLEARAVDNARMVQPKAGSPTHLNDTDAAAVAERVGTVARGVRQMASHDWIGMGVDWLRSRGMNDQDAEALVRMSIDPAQTDAAIQQIAHRLGQGEARRFLSMRNAALLGAVSASTAGS